MPRLKGAWATLVGTVFVHRVFDFIPGAVLVVWVLATAQIPHWAVTSLIIIFSIGAVLLVSRSRLRGTTSAATSRASRRRSCGSSRWRGTGWASCGCRWRRRCAISLQFIGWVCQLFAVWTAMKAFSIDVDLSAAGLVLVLMNMAAIIPLWPGNVGIVQG